jgi:hypothetical protein
MKPSKTDFPIHPDSMTVEWLTQMLNSANQISESQSVREFTTTTVGEGSGVVGFVIRVTLAYVSPENEGPQTLVMKFSHEQEANRNIGIMLKLYEREVTFYNTVSSKINVPSPECYFAMVNKETGESLIVLEDLGRFRTGDQLKGINETEVKLVVDAFVPLHILFWDNTNQDFLEDTPRVDTTWKEMYIPSVDGTWEPCKEKFGHCMPEEIKNALPEYISGLGKLHNIMGDRTQTLLHGDPRMDNLMFSDDVEGAPLVLIDWQVLLISNPLHDLSLTLSMSAPVETRRLIEDDMVRYYHSKLVEGGVKNYSIEQCFEDYNLSVLYMLTVGLIMGGAFDPANERGKQLTEAVIKRSSAAIMDRGLLALIPKA